MFGEGDGWEGRGCGGEGAELGEGVLMGCCRCCLVSRRMRSTEEVVSVVSL